MRQSEKEPIGLLKSAENLRQLILDNPDLPLIVFAGERASSEDYCWSACTYVKASIGEVLDCQQEIDDERVYTDRDDFEADVENALSDDFQGTDEEFEAAVEAEVTKYDPYWKKCIIIYVNN